MAPPALILASRSPQRAQLLREAGYQFEQADPPFADPPHPDDTAAHPEETTLDLARRKAASLGAMLAPRSAAHLIIAADTVCVSDDGRLVGQASDRAQAQRILRGFVNRTHRVVTGVALLGRGENDWDVFADTAAVTWGAIDDAAIDRYLDSGAWRGKAGAYNLFDRLADGWPIEIAGDPATVVGLPMRRLVPLLRRRGITPRNPRTEPLPEPASRGRAG